MSRRRKEGKTLYEIFAAENPPPMEIHTLSMPDPTLRGGWRSYELPITLDQLLRAREMYLEDMEYAISKKMTLGYVPQTVARGILLNVAPQLKNLDLIIAGFAVTNLRVKFDGELLKVTTRWKKAHGILKRASTGI